MQVFTSVENIQAPGEYIEEGIKGTRNFFFKYICSFHSKFIQYSGCNTALRLAHGDNDFFDQLNVNKKQFPHLQKAAVLFSLKGADIKSGREDQ